jgi:hypothetical protein
MVRCVFQSPLIYKPLLGLEESQGQLRLCAQELKCCGAMPLRWDEEAQAYRSCTLRQRKTKLEQLQVLAQGLWPAHGLRLLLQPAPLESTLFLPWLQTASRQGVYTVSRAQDTVPSPLWRYAALFSWHRNEQVHVYSLTKSPIHQRLPSETSPPKVVFVEGAGQLWKPEPYTALATLISWCDNAQVPLWLDLRIQAQETAPPPRTVSRLRVAAAVAQRMAEKKSRDPVSWLGSDLLSRLRRVSSPMEPYEQQYNPYYQGGPAPTFTSPYH